MRQKVDENAQPEVIIVNLKNGNSVMRRPIKADSAIMHWDKEIIALKAGGKTLQIFDLAQKSKIKSTTMAEDVVFWKWFSESSLGLVTDTSVYHWNIFDASQVAPVKVFDRNQNLSGCQIINYRVSDDEKWMVVVGISQQQGRVVGAMQLYSRDRGISQAIEGHAAAFGTLRLEDATADSKLFAFANRSANGAKLHIVEVDHTAPNPVFQKRAVDIYFPQEATNDFPVAMQVSSKYKVIYLVTKYGFIHLFDLETGTTIFMNRISSETIFTTASDGGGYGIVSIPLFSITSFWGVAMQPSTVSVICSDTPGQTSTRTLLLSLKRGSRALSSTLDKTYHLPLHHIFMDAGHSSADSIGNMPTEY